MTRKLGSVAIPFTHIVVKFTSHKMQRRFVVNLYVVKRVGENLGKPDESTLYVHYEEQVDGAENHCADANIQPDYCRAMDQAVYSDSGFEKAKEARVNQQQKWGSEPNGQQYDLSPQVVSNFHVLFVLVRGLVYVVIRLGFEKKSALFGEVSSPEATPPSQR